jgi:hypothetical protein
MDDAKRIAVVGYRQVLADGKDVCDSESDAEYSDHGEELTSMYTTGASLASAKMTSAQANALRAAPRSVATQQASSSGSESIRSPTPLNSDEHSEELTEDQKRVIRRFTKKSGGAGGQCSVRAPGQTIRVRYVSSLLSPTQIVLFVKAIPQIGRRRRELSTCGKWLR